MRHHAVVTSVDRDDLPDGGAKQFVKVIEAIRHHAGFLPEVQLAYEEELRLLWVTIKPELKPVFTLQLLESLGKVQQAIIDPEGDFVSFSERFGHIVVDANRTPSELARIANRIRYVFFIMIGYVVLAALAFALLARWAAGRALMKVNTP